MLHPDARISATMQVKIQSHPGVRWTVSCCALNKRDGRSLTNIVPQVPVPHKISVPICASRRKNRVLTTPLDSKILRRCAEKGYTSVDDTEGSAIPFPW